MSKICLLNKFGLTCLLAVICFFTDSASASPIVLKDSIEPVPFLDACSFHVSDNRIDVFSAKELEYSKEMPLLLKFGIATGECWIKFEIENRTKADQQLVFVQNNRYIDTVELYAFQQGTMVDLQGFYLGHSLPMNYELYLFGHSFHLNVPQAAHYTYYIRLSNESDLLTFAGSIYRQGEFVAKKETNLLGSGICLGLLLFLFFFCLLFFWNKSVVFKYHSFYTLSVILFTMHVNGLLHHLFPFLPERVHDLIFSVIMIINLYSFIFFIINLFDLRKKRPSLYSILKFYAQIILPVIFLVLINAKDTAFFVAVITGAPLLVFSLIASTRINKTAGLYFLFVTLLAAFSVYLARNNTQSYDVFLNANIYMLAYISNVIVLFVIVLRLYWREQNAFFEELEERQLRLKENGKMVLEQKESLEREIAAREEAETKVTHIQEQLVESNKMEIMGRLAGGIAHDFNNMLTPIIGHADLAIEMTEEDEVKEDLGLILKSALRAKDLVKQILTFSRRYKPEPVPVDVYKVVQETMELLHSSFPKNIQLEYSLSSERMHVLASEVQLQQVILNLCTNAKDAIGQENGTIRIKQEKLIVKNNAYDLKNGPYGKIMIADTGAGIEEEKLQQIFFPFYTTKPKGSGTGLGLSVAHGIITGYGGAIIPQSTVGKGTCFSIYLPITDSLQSKADETAAEPKKMEHTEARILVVDDEELIRNMMATKLKKIGYSVDLCANGAEAYSFLSKNPECVDLIITDQMMPEMSGDELATKVKTRCSRSKIIMMTGYSEKISGKSIKELQVDELILKPFQFTEMIGAIESVLHGGSGRQETNMRDFEF